MGQARQAYARPTGKERSMVYNEESQKWEVAPIPEKGAPSEEKNWSSVHLKRGPGTAVSEPKAKTGSVSATQDPAKGVELKPQRQKWRWRALWSGVEACR